VLCLSRIYRCSALTGDTTSGGVCWHLVKERGDTSVVGAAAVAILVAAISEPDIREEVRVCGVAERVTSVGGDTEVGR
jgi:hypothetical protein